MTEALASRKQPFRILLAEDNQADVWLIREALRRQSLECDIDGYETASSAIAAVLRCGTDGVPVPDLILVDYNLPAGHGGDVLEAAATNPELAHVPKAIMSSFIQPKELERMRQLGARRCVPKPADLHEFLLILGTTVSELLSGSPAQTPAGKLRLDRQTTAGS